MGDQGAPPIAVVASEFCPPDSAYLASYKGRDPECTDHRPGVPHLPCWDIVAIKGVK